MPASHTLSYSISRPYILDSSQGHTRVALTYNASFGNDGFGAQLQRIIGIYCVCVQYGFIYVHTPMEAIDYQGLHGMTHGHTSNALRRANARLTGLAPYHVPTTMARVHVDGLTLPLLSTLRPGSLYSVLTPYGLTNAKPKVLRHAPGSPIFAVSTPRNRNFTIGIHLRRGDLLVRNSHLMLPNSYYIEVVQRVRALCVARGVEPMVELYTEVPDGVQVVTPDNPDMQRGRARINRPVVLRPQEMNLNEFRMIPRLAIVLDAADPLVTFDRMVNCDILIVSRSSFSLAAAWLKNHHSISVYPVEYAGKNTWKGYQTMPDKDVAWRSSDPASALRKVDAFLTARGANDRPVDGGARRPSTHPQAVYPHTERRNTSVSTWAQWVGRLAEALLNLTLR